MSELVAILAVVAVMPNCQNCGHPFGWHVPKSIITNKMSCHKRKGMRRKVCSCIAYNRTGSRPPTR
jgi:hypothetical protein